MTNFLHEVDFKPLEIHHFGVFFFGCVCVCGGVGGGGGWGWAGRGKGITVPARLYGKVSARLCGKYSIFSPFSFSCARTKVLKTKKLRF